MIRLDAGALAAIREHGRETYPEECCGALLGTAGNGAVDKSAVPGDWVTVNRLPEKAANGAAVDQTQRDDDGFLMSPTEDFSTSTYAIVSEQADLDGQAPLRLEALRAWAVRDPVESSCVRASDLARPSRPTRP